jgi:hypothetical protein
LSSSSLVLILQEPSPCLFRPHFSAEFFFQELRAAVQFVFIIHISHANGKDWCMCHIKEVRGYWRKLHNEEPLDLCCPTDIVRGIKLRRARWAEHTAHTHTHTHRREQK